MVRIKHRSTLSLDFDELFVGDYYFVEAGNQLLEMNITTCDGAVSPNATVVPSSSPSATGTTDQHSDALFAEPISARITLLVQCALLAVLAM